MPMCKKCNREHFNFDACLPPLQPVPMAGPNPWGSKWGNAPSGPLVVYKHPPRPRTGRLTPPPEAA